MECPKCHDRMQEVTTAAGVVDRCAGCAGLWFDLLEHEDQRPYAAQLDIGDPQLGARHNQNDRIRCPRCPNSWLVRMVDAGQPHIWFESCPSCYGRFMDAGEFRDLSSHTLTDFYKRWTLKPRTLL